MFIKHRYNHLVIQVIILVVGLGLTLAVPLLANRQSKAAQQEMVKQNNSPELARWYVSKDGNDKDGKTWETAFTTLQTGLGQADGGDEIWVAKGVYKPGSSVYDTFLLVNGAVMFGGFAGTETNPEQRDLEKNPTILSGDIGGDDEKVNGVVLDSDHIKGDNSFHVVTADGTLGTKVTNNTVLDGFTITAGFANGTGSDYDGGGLFCKGAGGGRECSPSLVNVTFSGNKAQRFGGGMLNSGHSNGESSPSFRNVSFIGNSGNFGGAVYNDGNNGTSKPSFTNVLFSGNSATNHGGAVYNYGLAGGTSNPSFSNVTFEENSADIGGAVYNNGYLGESSPSFSRVIFRGNSVSHNGGALLNDGHDNGTSSPHLINVLFSGNSAVNNGGAIYNDSYKNGSTELILTNVTFTGNYAASQGGAIYNYGTQGTCTVDARNSIFWNNKDHLGTGTVEANIYNKDAITAINHSLLEGFIEGGSSLRIVNSGIEDGGGNINKDPKFITPVDPSYSPTIAGNVRLRSGSPAINAGKNDFVTVSTDLDDNERIIAGVVDMGAYEAMPIINLPLIIR